MSPTPHLLALTSALCSAVATTLIQRGLQRSNPYAGFWVNVIVGAIGLWAAVLLLVPFEDYHWRAVPYFVLSGVVGTAAGRLFRVTAIEKVGAPVAASINNLSPFFATGLAILLLGERVTLPILLGTLVIVGGTVLLSLSGKQVGFRVRHLGYPLLSASCFAVVAIIRKLGVSQGGPLFDAAINSTAALVASTAFVLASGRRSALVCERRSLLYFIGGGVAENTGVFLVLVALSLGEVSVVTPLAGTAPLFVLLLTVLFLRRVERLSWRIVVGAVLIVGGVFLLTGSTPLARGHGWRPEAARGLPSRLPAYALADERRGGGATPRETWTAEPRDCFEPDRSAQPRADGDAVWGSHVLLSTERSAWAALARPV
jgi:DME family drug/metabolite transporter